MKKGVGLVSRARAQDSVPPWVWVASVCWVLLFTALLIYWPNAGAWIALVMVVLLIAVLGVGVYLEKRSGR